MYTKYIGMHICHHVFVPQLYPHPIVFLIFHTAVPVPYCICIPCRTSASQFMIYLGFFQHLLGLFSYWILYELLYLFIWSLLSYLANICCCFLTLLGEILVCAESQHFYIKFLFACFKNIYMQQKPLVQMSPVYVQTRRSSLPATLFQYFNRKFCVLDHRFLFYLQLLSFNIQNDQVPSCRFPNVFPVFQSPLLFASYTTQCLYSPLASFFNKTNFNIK